MNKNILFQTADAEIPLSPQSEAIIATNADMLQKILESGKPLESFGIEIQYAIRLMADPAAESAVIKPMGVQSS